jgi:DNA-binding protein HU-beta
MNREELVSVVAKETGFTKKDVAQLVTAFTDVISESLAQQDKVQIAGFGAFDVRYRPEREARNPRTGETITAPASNAPFFKPSKILKELVNEKE